MPEGDTLYKIQERLRAAALGAVVSSFELPRRDTVVTRVVGSRIEQVDAYGKNLFIGFSCKLVLHVHLKMLGAVRVLDPARVARVFLGEVSARIVCGEGDARVGIVVLRAPVAHLVRPAEMQRIVSSLGPDPLRDGFSVDAVVERLRALDDTPLGEAIMDQRAMAGVGNVYKSEILFAKGMDPFAPVHAYTGDELAALVKHTEIVMRANVEQRLPRVPAAGGVRYAFQRRTRSPRAPGSGAGAQGGQNPHAVYMRHGKGCLTCGGRILSRPQGEQQRVTYFCPVCQPHRSEAEGEM